MHSEDARTRSERIRNEIRSLTDQGLSQQQILSLFYLRAKWRSRLSSECRIQGARSEMGRE
ncbi:MAG: hypothetical protein FJ029_08410 [Actinobacteria bacterium]|nr:hypothetical protein [Actinomycetota bacterium]